MTDHEWNTLFEAISSFVLAVECPCITFSESTVPVFKRDRGRGGRSGRPSFRAICPNLTHLSAPMAPADRFSFTQGSF